MKMIMVVVGIIVLALGLSFGFNLLLTKGLIWVMFELFHVDWRDKFWPVFVMLYIIGCILGTIGKAQSK